MSREGREGVIFHFSTLATVWGGTTCVLRLASRTSRDSIRVLLHQPGQGQWTKGAEPLAWGAAFPAIPVASLAWARGFRANRAERPA